MGVGHEHDGLFGIIDMYGEGLAFFKDGDAYPYASGFSDAAEAMGFRIAWNREQDKSLQIESVICEKHGVGMTKDGDLILSAFRARLVDVGGRFGKGHSNIYGLDDCRIHGGLLPIVEFYDMDVNRDRYPAGEVVADYYANTLLRPDAGEGVIDVGGERSRAWTDEEFSRVVEWLAYRLDRLGYDWRPHPMYRGRNFREPEDR